MWFFRGVILLLSMTFLAASTVWSFSGFLNVTVSGSVVPRPCKINGGNPIEVNFGDVMTTRMDNESYKQKMDYTLDCDTPEDPTLQLKFTGDVADFDNRYLKTNVDDLGVLFKNENNNIYMETPISFEYAKPPILYAVLMKKSGATLPSKAFNAAVTMQVYYN